MNALTAIPYISEPRLASKRGTRTWGTEGRMRLRQDEDLPIPIPPGEDPPPPIQEPPDKPVMDPPAPVREPGPREPRRL